jgi:putative lipoprotein
MNRIVSTLLVALVPLLLVAAAITASATAPNAEDAESLGTAVASLPSTVRGSVVWGQLAVLPPDARVTVRLVDVSRSDGTVVMLGEQAVRLEANPYPAQFDIPYDAASIRPGGLYAVVGRYAAVSQHQQDTGDHARVHGPGSPLSVQGGATVTL